MKYKQIQGLVTIPEIITEDGETYSAFQMQDPYIGVRAATFDFETNKGIIEVHYLQTKTQELPTHSRNVYVDLQQGTINSLQNTIVPQYIDSIIERIYPELKNKNWQ